MALTVKQVRRIKLGGANAVVADVTFDTQYPTGGEDITPTQLGITALDTILAEKSGGYSFEYNHTTKKLIAYVAAGTEVVDTTDIHTVTARITVIGL